MKVRIYNKCIFFFRFSFLFSISIFFLSALFFFTGCRTIDGLININAADVANSDDSLEQPFQALDNLDPKIRAQGAHALGNLTPVKNRHMESYLRSLDESDNVKTQKALSEIDDLAMSLSPVVEALVNSSRDYDSRVRFESLSSLNTIYDQIIIAADPLEQFETMSADDKQNIAKSAKNSSITIREMAGNTLSAMTSALNDPVRKVRKIAEKFILNSKRKSRIIEIPLDNETAILEENKPSVIESVPTADLEDVKKETETAGVTEKSSNIVSDVKKENESIPKDTLNDVKPAPEIHESIIEKPDSIKETKKEDLHETLAEDPPAASKDQVEEINSETTINAKNIERFLKQLESFELSNRRFALMAMAPYIEKELAPIPETINSVEKGDIAIRIESADSIVARVDHIKDVVTSLCRATEDVDKEMRIKSLKNLGQIIEPLATALTPFDKAPREIEDALTKEKVEVEQLVKIQIEQFKKSSDQGIEKITAIIVQSIPVLIKSLDDKILEVRNTASEGLRAILASAEKDVPLKPAWDSLFKKMKMTPDDIKIRLLMNDLSNPGVDMARAAARTISEMGVSAKAAVPSLIEVVKNKQNLHVHYKYVQMDAMAALGSMGAEAKDAIPALMDQLGDIRFEIRSSSAIALGRIGGKAATPYIVDMFENDKSSLVRESAAEALTTLDPSDCLDKAYVLLFKALKDSSDDIRMHAFNALVSYELNNKGAGIIMWKPFDKTVKGYTVCAGAAELAECKDNGFGTAFRLGDFKSIPRNGSGVTVKSLQEDSDVPVEFKYIDIMSILEKSASNETNPGLREKKNKALLELMKGLLNKGSEKK